MERETNTALAFRQEFYEGASHQQIVDDVVSYLGEYRFEVPEFSYKMGLINGKLTDPNTGDAMTVKAKKAIETRQKDGLKIQREEAELEGLLSIENQIKEKKGTIVWFSPPGDEKDGYGKYGFAYTGKVGEDFVEMTAIRVEDPKITDFNDASKALWGEDYKEAQSFLSSPKVVDIEEDKVRNFIHGNFEIKNQNGKEIFSRALKEMDRAINDLAKRVANGQEKDGHAGFHVIENMSIELKNRFEQETQGNIIFMQDLQMPDLDVAITLEKYKTPPPAVKGSCGMSSRTQSNEIFRNIMFNQDSPITGGGRDFDFNTSGPCRLCERDVLCGPCKICRSCNDKIDSKELID